MSDPMTNVEIEDVLSSIRRLVAEGTPAKPASAAELASAAKPARTMPKLVLTPALRVDASQDSTPNAPIRLQEAQRVDAFAPPLPTLISIADPDGDRLNLLATIAELEAAVRNQTDEWEPDGTGTRTEQLTWARAGFRGDVEVEDAEEAIAAPVNISAWPRTLVEAAKRYGEAQDTPEDDAVQEAEFRHHAAKDAARSQADDTDFNDDSIGGPELGDDAEEMLNRYLADDAVIDENMLRDLVRDIVRQELQGKLGERITRNVRKMVRREINRTMTTQNFD